MNPFKALFELISLNIKYLPQSFSMAGSDLKKRYSGSMFGWAWAVVRPLVFVGVYWFAMSVGIRGNKPITLADGREVSYMMWMIPGVITWFILQETLSSGVMCVRRNEHLVKKMVFPIGTIPVFSVIGYYFSHILMIVFAFIVLGAGGYISIYALQLPFYFILFFFFNCTVATFISALGVVSRDFEQLIKAVMNVFFWMSPVLWQLDGKNIKSKVLEYIIKINPYNFFVNGYREAFLGGKWFWEHPVYTLYTIGFILVFALFTAILYKKLAPEFADVL